MENKSLASIDIQKLLSGFSQFRQEYFSQTNSAERFRTLVEEGQKPKIMLISCSDSRVEPADIFNCSPGDLFVVRNVANLVPPCDPNPRHHSTSAALEFGVKHLEVRHIIILGHSQCGGIRALLETADNDDAAKTHKSFIFNWVQIAADAKHKVLADPDHPHHPFDVLSDQCEEEALKISFRNLQSFPWISDVFMASSPKVS